MLYLPILLFPFIYYFFLFFSLFFSVAFFIKDLFQESNSRKIHKYHFFFQETNIALRNYVCRNALEVASAASPYVVLTSTFPLCLAAKNWRENKILQISYNFKFHTFLFIY